MGRPPQTSRGGHHERCREGGQVFLVRSCDGIAFAPRMVPSQSLLRRQGEHEEIRSHHEPRDALLVRAPDPVEALHNNNSHYYFEALSAQIKTGATGTNVADLVISLA